MSASADDAATRNRQLEEFWQMGGLYFLGTYHDLIVNKVRMTGVFVGVRV